jgi:RimJ/RimL family protein N-acetyltransferase
MKYKEEIFKEFTEEITHYMRPCAPKKASETETFIHETMERIKNNQELVVAILKQESQEFLGCAAIHEVGRKDPELGIWLKKTAHGNKYGLEAIAALKYWADIHLSYEYCRYPVDRANIASRKIPEALGGKVVREFDVVSMSGNTLHLLEYRIDKICDRTLI